MIEKSRVRTPAGAAGEFSSPGSAFCDDSYFGIRSAQSYRSSTLKIPIILSKKQVAVSAKHTYTLHMWLWLKWHCKLVHGWMVYTELAPRRQQFQVAPAVQEPKSAISTPLPWIFKTKTRRERIQSLIQNHMRHERSESVREQRIAAIYKSYE